MGMFMSDMLMQVGSAITTLALTWALYRHYVPEQLRDFINSSVPRYAGKAARFFSPYQDITFDEYVGGEFSDRSEIYSAIETYISETSASMARRMKGNLLQGKSLLLSIADHEEVMDEYKGVKVWWASDRTVPQYYTFSLYGGDEAKRFYRLSFHGRHKELITNSYLNHVLEEGEAIKIRKRTRKLYTNTKDDDTDSWRRKSTMWSHIEFKHPGTFETLAMEPQKKHKIIEDLRWFSNAKAYYQRIGKAWKRGYLLFGPPGTGKSTMVAAMANLLEYDIYDLELTAVKNNIQLRKLLVETTSKSIILIEDIDCSLDLTGQRKTEEEEEEEEGEEKDVAKKLSKDVKKKKGSKVTLSGLLNFIDGVWSACAEERIIVFTTNYVDKLDPALIRRGRMDMWIELGYCCFDSFKVLARNYLEIEAHLLFGDIERLLGETETTPADVAEHLMPKCRDVDVDSCLESLVEALVVARDGTKEKAEKAEDKITKE